MYPFRRPAMKIGTKSLLFGAHQFLLHPLQVAMGWYLLYGLPLDPRLWYAFVVHDWGYWGRSDMDGEDGEKHPIIGAGMMGFMFDRGINWELLVKKPNLEARLLRRLFTAIAWVCDKVFGVNAPSFDGKRSISWMEFTLFHSRFCAKQYRAQPSMLCMADKLVTCITPSWLFFFLTELSGELDEYMERTRDGKYTSMNHYSENREVWFKGMVDYIWDWVMAHMNGEPDLQTPAAS
jgi:hypothetical protein